MSKQTMPEKLRLIADCIETGKTVECLVDSSPSWKEMIEDYVTHIVIRDDVTYRAKPDKPRTVYIEATPSGGMFTCSKTKFDSVTFYEATPEVLQALKDAGVDYE